MQYCQYERPPSSGLYNFVQSENAQKPNRPISFVNRKTEVYPQHIPWNKNDSNSHVDMPKKKSNKEENEEAHSRRNYFWKRRGPKGPTLKANICDSKIPPSKADDDGLAWFEELDVSGERTEVNSTGHCESTGHAESVGYVMGHGESIGTSSAIYGDTGGDRSDSMSIEYSKSTGSINSKSIGSKSEKSTGRIQKTKTSGESTLSERANALQYFQGMCSPSPPLPASTVAYCQKNPLMKKILDNKPVVRLKRLSQKFIDKKTSSDKCGKQFSSSSCINGQTVNRVVSASFCQTNKNDGSTTLASGHSSTKLPMQTSANKAKNDDILVDPKIMLLSTPLQKACSKGKHASSLTFEIQKSHEMVTSPIRRTKTVPKKQMFNLEKLRNKLRKSYLSSQTVFSSATDSVLTDIDRLEDMSKQLNSKGKSDSSSRESLQNTFQSTLDCLPIPKDIFETDIDLSKRVVLESDEARNCSNEEQSMNLSCLDTAKKDDLKVTISRKVFPNSVTYSLAPVRSDPSHVSVTNSCVAPVRSDPSHVSVTNSRVAPVRSDPSHVSVTNSRVAPVRSDPSHVSVTNSRVAPVRSDSSHVSVTNSRVAPVRSDPSHVSVTNSRVAPVRSDPFHVSVTKSRVAPVRSDPSHVSVTNSRVAPVRSDPSHVSVTKSRVAPVRSDPSHVSVTKSRVTNTNISQQTGVERVFSSSVHCANSNVTSRHTQNDGSPNSKNNTVESSVDTARFKCGGSNLCTNEASEKADSGDGNKSNTQKRERHVECMRSNNTSLTWKSETQKSETQKSETQKNETQKRETQKSETHIEHMPTNTSIIQKSKINSKCVQHSETNSKGVQHNETNSKCVQHSETNSKGVQHNETNSKGVQHSETNSKGVQHSKTNSKCVQHSKTDSKGVQHSKTNSKGVQHSKTNSKGVQHSKTDSKGVQHSKTDSKCVQHSKTNSKCVQHGETNSKGVQHSEINSKCVQHSKTNSKCVQHSKTNSKCVQHSKTNSKCVQHSEINSKCVQHSETNSKCVQHSKTNSKGVQHSKTDSKGVQHSKTNSKCVQHSEINSKCVQGSETNEAMKSETKDSCVVRSETRESCEIHKAEESETNHTSEKTIDIEQSKTNTESISNDVSDQNKPEIVLNVQERNETEQIEIDGEYEIHETEQIEIDGEYEIHETEQIEIDRHDGIHEAEQIEIDGCDTESKMCFSGVEKNDTEQIEISVNIEIDNMESGEMNLDMDRTGYEQTELSISSIETNELDQTEISFSDVEKSDKDKTEINISKVKQKTEIEKTEVNANDVERTEMKKTEISARDVERTEIGARDVDRTEINARDEKTTEIIAIDAEITEVEKTEITRDVEKTYLKKTETSDSNVLKTDETEINATDMKTTEIEQTETSSSNIKKTEINNTETSGSDVEITEINATDVDRTGMEKNETSGKDMERTEMKKTKINAVDMEKTEKEMNEKNAMAIEREMKKKEISKRHEIQDISDNKQPEISCVVASNLLAISQTDVCDTSEGKLIQTNDCLFQSVVNNDTTSKERFCDSNNFQSSEPNTCRSVAESEGSVDNGECVYGVNGSNHFPSCDTNISRTGSETDGSVADEQTSTVSIKQRINHCDNELNASTEQQTVTDTDSNSAADPVTNASFVEDLIELKEPHHTVSESEGSKQSERRVDEALCKSSVHQASTVGISDEQHLAKSELLQVTESEPISETQTVKKPDPAENTSESHLMLEINNDKTQDIEENDASTVSQLHDAVVDDSVTNDKTVSQSNDTGVGLDKETVKDGSAVSQSNDTGVSVGEETESNDTGVGLDKETVKDGSTVSESNDTGVSVDKETVKDGSTVSESNDTGVSVDKETVKDGSTVSESNDTGVSVDKETVKDGSTVSELNDTGVSVDKETVKDGSTVSESNDTGVSVDKETVKDGSTVSESNDTGVSVDKETVKDGSTVSELNDSAVSVNTSTVKHSSVKEEPVDSENSLSNEVRTDTAQSALHISHLVMCNAELDDTPLCVISLVEGGATGVLNEEDETDDECPELLDGQSDNNPACSYNYVYSPPPLINVGSMLLSENTADGSPIPSQYPVTTVYATPVSAPLDINKELLSSYSKFILPKPDKAKLCQSMNRRCSTQGSMHTASSIITPMPMSLPVVVGTFLETKSPTSMQLTKLSNNSVPQGDINILNNSQTECFTHTTSTPCNTNSQFPNNVSSNSIDQIPPLGWQCQSQNIGHPASNKQPETLVQNNLKILERACSADIMNSQNSSSRNYVAVNGEETLNKNIILDEVTKGRKSPDTDDSDATMIYCEDAEVVKRDLENNGNASLSSRVRILLTTKLVIDDKQTEEKQDTIKVTSLKGKRKERIPRKRKSKMMAHKQQEKNARKKNGAITDESVDSIMSSRLAKTHDVFDFRSDGNDSEARIQQVKKGKSVQFKTQHGLENKSNTSQVLTSVTNNSPSYQDIFRKAMIENMSQDIPEPADKSNPVKKRKQKRTYRSTKKRRLNDKMDIVVDHAEDLDCEKLPTILPPKRVRCHMNNEHSVMRESLAVPIGSSERLQRDFPRHNWLEEKIHKLQEYTSPPQPVESSSGINEQKSSTPKQQSLSNGSHTSTPDPPNPVKRCCKRPLSSKQTKTSGKKVAKLNCDVKDSSEQDIQLKYDDGLSDIENNLFACSTDNTDNPLQIDIPVETNVSKSPDCSVGNKHNEIGGEVKDSAVEAKDEIGGEVKDSAVEAKDGCKDKANGADGLVVSPVVDEDDSSQNSDRMEVDLDYQEPSDADLQSSPNTSKADETHRSTDSYELPIDLTTKRQDLFSSSSRQKVGPPVQKVLPQIQQSSERVNDESNLTIETKNLLNNKLKTSAPSTSADNSGDLSSVIVSNTSRISVVSPIKVTETVSVGTPDDHASSVNVHSNAGIGSAVDATKDKPPTSDGQSVQENCAMKSQTYLNFSQEDSSIPVSNTETSSQPPVPELFPVRSLVPVSAALSKSPASTPVLSTQSQDAAVSSESQNQQSPVNLSAECKSTSVEENHPSNESVQFTFSEDVSGVTRVSPKSLIPFSFPVPDRQAFVCNKEFQKHLLEYRQLEALAAKKEQEREHIVKLCKQKAQILKVISSKCQKTQNATGVPVFDSNMACHQKKQKTDIVQKHLEPAVEIDLTQNLQQETLSPQVQPVVSKSPSNINSTPQPNSVVKENHAQEVSNSLKSKNITEENLSAEKRRPIVEMINLAMSEHRQASKKKHNSGDVSFDENKTPAHQSKPQTNHVIDQMYSAPDNPPQSCPYIKRSSPVHEPSSHKSITCNQSQPSPAHSQPPFHIAGSLIIPVDGQSKVDVIGRKPRKDSTELTVSASMNRPQQKASVMKSPDEFPAQHGMMGKSKDHISPPAVFPTPSSHGYQTSVMNGEINRSTKLINSDERHSVSSNLAFPSGAKKLPGSSMHSRMNDPDEMSKRNFVDLTKDNKLGSKTSAQKSNIPEPIPGSRGHLNELVIQCELQEALAMQNMQRAGFAESRKLSQFNKLSEMSARNHFSSLPTSFASFQAANHSPEDGHLVSRDTASITPNLMSLNAKHISNPSKSKAQGTYIQKHIDSNPYNAQKTAANHFYCKNSPISQAFPVPVTGDSVNYGRKEPHFVPNRHPNEVVQWRVSRNANSYLQAPEPRVSDTQQTVQKQLQHQVNPHFIPQPPNPLSDLQHRSSMVGFFPQPVLSRIPDVPQQYPATMARMHGAQPTSFPQHIRPQRTIPIPDTRVQASVSANKQCIPASYMSSSHRVSNNNGLPVAVQNKKMVQQQMSRSWPFSQNPDSIGTDHTQHMQPGHHLHPPSRIQQPHQQPHPMSQLSPSVQQSLQQSNCRCIVCGAHAMFLCSCCKQVWYCSKPCQDSHWAYHAHECRSSSSVVDRESVYVTN